MKREYRDIISKSIEITGVSKQRYISLFGECLELEEKLAKQIGENERWYRELAISNDDLRRQCATLQRKYDNQNETLMEVVRYASMLTPSDNISVPEIVVRYVNDQRKKEEARQ